MTRVTAEEVVQLYTKATVTLAEADVSLIVKVGAYFSIDSLNKSL